MLDDVFCVVHHRVNKNPQATDGWIFETPNATRADPWIPLEARKMQVDWDSRTYLP